MDDDTSGALVAVGAIVLVVVVIAATAIVQGAVFAQLWAWFVAPAFGLPQISTALAIGLSLTVNSLVRSSSEPEDKTKSKWERVGGALAKAFLAPLFSLGMGFIVKGFI